MAIQAALGGAAWALPQGATVAHGAVGISQGPGGLQVTAGHGAIINWQRFSIAPGEVARFVQPSTQSAVLNRVTGAEASQLLGQLQANGRVFLINPNGIVIGGGARIDTNGFVASTLDMADADFLAGRLRFSQGSTGSGSIRNEGFITTGPGGRVVLVAPDIANSGIVHAPNGEILLAAGRRVEIGSPDLPGVRFELQAPTDAVLNLGQLLADNGAVRAFAASVRHEGTIRADRLVQGADGRIVLAASGDLSLSPQSVLSATGGGAVHLQAGGTTRVAGLVDVRGLAGPGGEVQVLGTRVALEPGALLDASGSSGGRILVGGDYQGANPEVANAQRVSVAEGAVLRADADVQGNGGRIIVWADQSTRFAGALSVRGGAQGGDGGFAEVSGKQQLQFTGRADLSAPHGAAGTLLLDPLDIVIAADGGQMPELVDEFADFPDNVVTIAPAVLDAIRGDVMLQAERNVFVRDHLQLNTVGAGLTIRAGGASHDRGGIDLRGGITTHQGHVILRGSGLSGTGDITTNGGTVDVQVAGDLGYSGVIRAGGAGVRLESLRGAITGAPAIDASSVDAFAAGDISLRNLTGRVLRLGEVRAGGGIRLATDAGVAQTAGGRLSGQFLDVQASGTESVGASADAPLRVDVADLRFTGPSAPLHLRFDAGTVVRAVSLAGGVAALAASTITGGSNLGDWTFTREGTGLRFSAHAKAGFDGLLSLDVSGGGLRVDSLRLAGGAGVVLRTRDAGALRLGVITTGGSVQVQQLGAGDLAVGSVVADGQVALQSRGAVLGDDGSQPHVQASALDIRAGGDIRSASGGSLWVVAPSIDIESASGRFDVRAGGTVSTLGLSASAGGLELNAARFQSENLDLALSAAGSGITFTPNRWDSTLQGFRLTGRGAGLQVGDLTVAGSLQLESAGALAVGTLTAPTIVLRAGSGDIAASLVGTNDLTLDTAGGFAVQVNGSWLERLAIRTNLSRAFANNAGASLDVFDAQANLVQTVSYTGPAGVLGIASVGPGPAPWHVDFRDTSAEAYQGPQILQAAHEGAGSMHVELASASLVRAQAQLGDVADPNSFTLVSAGAIRLNATTAGGAVNVTSRLGDIQVDAVSTAGSGRAGDVTLQADQGSILGNPERGLDPHVLSGPGGRVSLSAQRGSVGGADALRIRDAGEIGIRVRDGIGVQLDGAPLSALSIEASVDGSGALRLGRGADDLQIGRQAGQLTLGGTPASLTHSFSLVAPDGGIAVVAPVAVDGDLSLHAQGGHLSLHGVAGGLLVRSGGGMELAARDDLRIDAAAGSVTLTSGSRQRLVAGRDLRLASGTDGHSVSVESGGDQDLQAGGAVSLHNASGDEVRVQASGGTQWLQAATLDIAVTGSGRFAGLGTANGNRQVIHLRGTEGVAGSARLSLRNTSEATGSLAAIDSSGALELQAGGFGYDTAGVLQVGSSDARGASRIQAGTSLGLVAGSLQILGGATVAGWAAVNAPDLMSISTLRGGIGITGGAAGAASIDPAVLSVAANGDLLLQGGGNGAASTITAGSFDLATTQGGLSLQANTGGAAINAQLFRHYFPGWNEVVQDPAGPVPEMPDLFGYLSDTQWFDDESRPRRSESPPDGETTCQ
nr:filamentous hemagglutinin N-terminal domain-containing protein [Ramlibacter aurantiacus]